MDKMFLLDNVLDGVSENDINNNISYMDEMFLLDNVLDGVSENDINNNISYIDNYIIESSNGNKKNILIRLWERIKKLISDIRKWFRKIFGKRDVSKALENKGIIDDIVNSSFNKNGIEIKKPSLDKTKPIKNKSIKDIYDSITNSISKNYDETTLPSNFYRTSSLDGKSKLISNPEWMTGRAASVYYLLDIDMINNIIVPSINKVKQSSFKDTDAFRECFKIYNADKYSWFIKPPDGPDVNKYLQDSDNLLKYFTEILESMDIGMITDVEDGELGKSYQQFMSIIYRLSFMINMRLKFIYQTSVSTSTTYINDKDIKQIKDVFQLASITGDIIKNTTNVKFKTNNVILALINKYYTVNRYENLIDKSRVGSTRVGYDYPNKNNLIIKFPFNLKGISDNKLEIKIQKELGSAISQFMLPPEPESKENGYISIFKKGTPTQISTEDKNKLIKDIDESLAKHNKRLNYKADLHAGNIMKFGDRYMIIDYTDMR